MFAFKYVGEDYVHKVDFMQISHNIVQIMGSFPIKEKGFTLSRLPEDVDGLDEEAAKNFWDGWDYSAFTTVYREIDGGVQFSNDGLVYVEPEPIPEPEPYVPTYKEVLDNKISELSIQCKYMIEYGLDIDGVHYSYTTEDQQNLKEIFDTVKLTGLPLGYHADSHNCIEYSAEELSNIYIQLTMNKYCQQTYFNQARGYLNSLEESDENKELIINYAYGTSLEGAYLETYNKMIELYNEQIVALNTIK